MIGYASLIALLAASLWVIQAQRRRLREVIDYAAMSVAAHSEITAKITEEVTRPAAASAVEQQARIDALRWVVKLRGEVLRRTVLGDHPMVERARERMNSDFWAKKDADYKRRMGL